MKKLIFVIVNFCFSVNVFAASNVTIFNASKEYDLSVNYKLCASNGHHENCQVPSDVKIENAKWGANYFQIELPSTEKEYHYVKVNSAIAKTNDGTIKSQTDFNNKKCEGSNHDAIILDDMSSDFILCSNGTLLNKKVSP